MCHRKYSNLSELAKAMGISVSQVYRVREGKRNINQKFIVGAIRAFPEYKFDDLFYFAPEPAAEAESEPESPQQALDRFTSAINDYAPAPPEPHQRPYKPQRGSQTAKRGYPRDKQASGAVV